MVAGQFGLSQRRRFMLSPLRSPITSPHQQHVDCHFRTLLVLSCGPNIPTDNNISVPVTFSTEEVVRKQNSSGANNTERVSCPTNADATNYEMHACTLRCRRHPDSAGQVSRTNHCQPTDIEQPPHPINAGLVPHSPQKSQASSTR